jgi:hypothetical protein
MYQSLAAAVKHHLSSSAENLAQAGPTPAGSGEATGSS